MTPMAERVLESLREAASDKNNTWSDVQLTRVKIRREIEKHRFSGYLSSLWAQGYYQPVDGRTCGRVRMT